MAKHNRNFKGKLVRQGLDDALSGAIGKLYSIVLPQMRCWTQVSRIHGSYSFVFPLKKNHSYAVKKQS